ncbi:hypothetical protein [Bacillus toyonensis]|uniref:hypothetical protein n=1 Tax=Bacillus toyonensis TaxID=155322 RepID=UPI000BFD170A|nr:hypothetical protein [Bacillus toyonensis]PHG57635.1 hypothetical protein COI59_29500 [Bacillus toyonensis]
MIHRYEIEFSTIYNGKITDLQSVIIPAYSLEEAEKKLQLEVQRRLGDCCTKINRTSLFVSKDIQYTIV